MTKIKAGHKAPKFEVKNQNDETISSEDLSGKKYILFFYPKDNTPGCTEEACNLRDNYDDLRAKGFEIYGVSVDSQRKHQNFINKFEFPFDLLADTEHLMVNAFDVWGPKKMFGKEFEGIYRTTFIIDENGIVNHVFEKVDTANHTQQILDVVDGVLTT
ncbi:MAG: thioredoxin-dependent thiol peroxidase [Flavobacteriales bacterium]|nr:thioredoxin-dependent thiol peroxidase [Flavobacteriales bacterium]